MNSNSNNSMNSIQASITSEMVTVMDYLFVPQYYLFQAVLVFALGYFFSHVDIKYYVAAIAAYELYAYNYYEYLPQNRAVVVAAGLAGYYMGKNKRRMLGPL